MGVEGREEKEKGGRRGDGSRRMRKKGGWGRNGRVREGGKGEGSGGRESVSAYVAPIREPRPPLMAFQWYII